MTLPRLWLMTDERLGDRLWEAIDRLPQGKAGIVFRHYKTEQKARLVLARRVAALCGGRQLTLSVARDVNLASDLDAGLVHNPTQATGRMPFSRAVHSIHEATAARDEGAALIFIAPVYATRSHPDRKPLGVEAAIQLAAAAGVPAIALGGLNRERFAPLQDTFHGWAAIDAWLS